MPLVGSPRKSKICLRPSLRFCLFIEIYWSIDEALKYYWRVRELNFYEEISNKF
jgi:hypothetical protein